MNIIEGGLDDPRVVALLAEHIKAARAHTSCDSAHVLDVGQLKSSDIRFWTAWEGDQVVGTGALKRLDAFHGEIKSMHTHRSHRRKGVAATILNHILAAGKQMGLTRISLETGSWPYFDAARELYKQHGFEECPPFGAYRADPNSVFMTITFGNR